MALTGIALASCQELIKSELNVGSIKKKPWLETHKGALARSPHICTLYICVHKLCLDESELLEKQKCVESLVPHRNPHYSRTQYSFFVHYEV